MTKEEIYLAFHDHMIDVPHLGGSHVAYELSPNELLEVIQSLLSLERDRCAQVCDSFSDSWRVSYQPIKAMAAEDIADILRKLK
jgi:hypothetical protein